MESNRPQSRNMDSAGFLQDLKNSPGCSYFQNHSVSPQITSSEAFYHSDTNAHRYCDQPYSRYPEGFPNSDSSSLLGSTCRFPSLQQNSWNPESVHQISHYTHGLQPQTSYFWPPTTEPFCSSLTSEDYRNSRSPTGALSHPDHPPCTSAHPCSYLRIAGGEHSLKTRSYVDRVPNPGGHFPSNTIPSQAMHSAATGVHPTCTPNNACGNNEELAFVSKGQGIFVGSQTEQVIPLELQVDPQPNSFGQSRIQNYGSTSSEATGDPCMFSRPDSTTACSPGREHCPPTVLPRVQQTSMSACTLPDTLRYNLSHVQASESQLFSDRDKSNVELMAPAVPVSSPQGSRHVAVSTNASDTIFTSTSISSCFSSVRDSSKHSTTETPLESTIGCAHVGSPYNPLSESRPYSVSRFDTCSYPHSLMDNAISATSTGEVIQQRSNIIFPPVPSSESTLHYRLNPGIDRMPCSTLVPHASGQYANSSIHTVGQAQPGIPTLPYFQPGTRLLNEPVESDTAYMYNRTQQPMHLPGHNPNRQTSLGYANHHLQPISSLAPNSPVSQLGPIYTHSRYTDAEKCNGLNLNDNSLYPPILPKLPGSPVKDNALTSRKGKTSDREAKNERRRQQRLRRKQELSNVSTNLVVTPDSQVLGAPEHPASVKRSRARVPKSTAESENTDQVSIKTPSDISGEELVVTVSKPVKRRNSALPVSSKQPKKIKPKNPQCDTEINVLLTVKEEPTVSQSVEKEAITRTTENLVKAVRTRPPRPKKRKPLPTLIRKKRRSTFYGDQSDSEPDISGRLGGRSEQKDHSDAYDIGNHDKKRRSERTAGDRKKYTIDLDLNLTDDDSDTTKNDDMSTFHSDTLTGMVEDNDIRVVEYVLGRRITKRVIKKQGESIGADFHAKTTIHEQVPQELNEHEEEEEEDVEEFYLKYKGYSYLHCEWRALDEIDDPRIRPKLRRFELKQATSVPHEDDDIVLFNPDYVEVERVLDMKVYCNGQPVTLDRVDSNLITQSDELRKQRRRERERNRARVLREAKTKLQGAPLISVVGHSESTLPTHQPEETTNSETTSRDTSEAAATEVDESLCEGRSVASVIGEPVGCAVPTSDQTLISPDLNASDSSISERLNDRNITINDPTEPSVLSSPSGSTITDFNRTADEKIPDMTPGISTKCSDSDSDGNVGTQSPITVTYYLVKWRSLPYEDATWELAQDVDPAKVKEFLKWRTPPKVSPVARDSHYKIIRPDPSTWRPIESDKVYKNANTLRDYQLEGVNWLTYCWFHHRNCILADEMGLGKTVQSVAFLLEIEKAGVPGPFLIIVPLSTVANWQRELENWSDLNVVVYHGSSTSRSMIQEYEIFYKRRPSDSAVRHDVYKFHVLVTTFEILMTDIEFFGRIHWAAAIIDEAHRLKNKKCKLGEGLRYLELDHRVLLTGTPLQNNVEELFGLLNFLEPEKFNCSSAFVAEYGDLKTEEQVESLKALLKPMMLRRLKEDVEKSLAPKEETIVEVELTNIQKKYYRAIMERNFSFLCKGSTYANAPNLMNVMMELRKCCNHPFLIKGAEDAILDEMRAQQDPNHPLSEDNQTFQALVYASGKLVLIHKLLPKLKANGHKVLIFSQMIRVLDILEDYLIHQRFHFERIDGRIHGPLRQEAIDRFTADPDKFVFLLCTKAGGLGINLTAADVVIIYDSDWNPQNDLQAQARCHRIGQQKMVKVYRLITRNTYEREMFDRASLKLGLDRAVLQSMGSKEARQAQMSKKEIEELLKKGAYGALMDDDKAGEEFCEEDIDKILQSRSRVVQLEQGEKNSTFSKATFSMSDNRSDIELDDPNFWQKWAKMAGVDETAGTLKDLILKTPRQRRQTSRYSALPINEPTVVNSPSYDASEQEDSATAQSSGDENTLSASGGRGRFRRRKQRRHSRHPPFVDIPRHVQFSLSDDMGQLDRLQPGRIDPLDRADLFRVERCLLTWPWGQWEKGLAMVPFKRQLSPMELSYFATAVLAFSLRYMPPSADTRIRTTVVTLSRPHVWNLSISEAAKAVFKATSRASRGCRTVSSGSATSKVDPEEPIVRPCSSDGESASSADVPHTPVVPTILTEDIVTNVTESDMVGCVSANVNEDAETIPVKDSIAEPPSSTYSDVDENVKSRSETDFSEASKVLSEKPETEPQSSSIPCKNISPKTASFDPDYLVPYDSFRKHMQRHSPRLFNRVAFLFFLQCEVVGVEQTVELVSGRLNHEDFTELAASLPPLEAIDSEPPTQWWDSCCDKCLLLGILKHGWEKYTLMRIDPSLCFYGRAMARLKELEDKKDAEPLLGSPFSDEGGHPISDKRQSTELMLDSTPADSNALCSEFNQIKESDSIVPKDSPKNEMEDDVDKNDDEHLPFAADEDATALDQSVVDSLLTALLFPAVADLNSRARKIVGFFSRIKNQLEFDANRHVSAEDEEESAGTSLPPARFMENRTTKWTRREEADFYRVVSSFGVEFTSIPTTPTESSPNSGATPVRRRYRWHNFRQLSNINRKSDIALTEYFHSFYRMCQRVCKRKVTEFAGPASTSATATTSGSGALGEEVPIEPISEERANRCLSRIDLLARIRNEILSHPQLDERLKLCRRSSETPSWWIPGKHDGELLRAAAKHGLARTDLNMLSDPEFSFHQFINALRDKGARESAGAALSKGDHADAALFTPYNALKGMPHDSDEQKLRNFTDETRVTKTNEKDCLDNSSHDPEENSGATPGAPPTDSVHLNAVGQVEFGSHPKSSTTVSTDGAIPARNSGTFPPDAGESQLPFRSDGLSNDWSAKYTCSLTNIWPKDRTIQHRLELVCQTIETNEWPMPRRYLPTPSALLISDSSRTSNNSNDMSNLPPYSGVRHPVLSTSFPLALSLPNSLQSPYEIIRAISGSKRLLKVNRSSDHNSNQSTLDLLSNESDQLAASSDMGDPSTLHSLIRSSPSHDGISSPISYPTGSPTSISRAPELGYKRRARGSYRTVSSLPSNSVNSHPLNSRGRSRGRGRGSRGSRILSSRGRGTSASSVKALPESTETSSPASEHLPEADRQGITQRGSESSDISHSDCSMLPPTVRSGGRGRKRRIDVLRGSATDLSTGHSVNTSKRERIDSSGTDFTAKPRSSRSGSFSSAPNSDVWEVRVPVISLVDGSLIYGEQAPKRRVLEQWLEANPNYMPYSVEVEDRIIYNRVASSRGQDTNNMEALAYKHYLNSLIMNATVGLQQSTSSKSSPLSSSAQLVQLQQHQQLLQAFGAYARHPAYANLLASALSSWSVPMGTTLGSSSSESTGTIPSSSDTITLSAKSLMTPLVQSPSAAHHTVSSSSDLSTTVISHEHSSRAASPATSSTLVTTTSILSNSAPFTGMESALSAAYKQATSNLAYICNPLAAAAAYSQMMLSATASNSSEDSSANNISNQQQAVIASLYANYMLAAKQAQQQQMNLLDQQRQQQQQQQQQIAAVAAAIAAACASSGTLDTTALLSMLSSSQPRTTLSGVSITSVADESGQSIQSVSSTTESKSQSVTSHQNSGPTSPVNFSASVPNDSSTFDSDQVVQNSEGDQGQSVLDLSK